MHGTPPTKTQRFVALNIGFHKNDRRRDPHDFHPTPPPATAALLKVERFVGRIWEPACGKGDCSEVLKAAGYEVYSSDLIDRGYGDVGLNFLHVIGSIDGDDEENIVTNPPYRHLVPFVKKACQLAKGKVAMLLRVGALAGLERKALFEKTGLTRVWIISNRINFDPDPEARNQGGAIDFAWFVWDLTVPPPAMVQVGFIVAEVPLSRRRVQF